MKVVGGDRFTPTSAFIEGRLAHLIESGCIEQQHSSKRMGATRAGTACLARLLRLEVDPGAAALWAFWTTLKLSLLDLVGAECRRDVAATLLGAGRARERTGDGAVGGLRRYRGGALSGPRAGTRGARDALAAGGDGIRAYRGAGR